MESARDRELAVRQWWQRWHQKPRADTSTWLSLLSDDGCRDGITNHALTSMWQRAYCQTMAADTIRSHALAPARGRELTVRRGGRDGIKSHGLTQLVQRAYRQTVAADGIRSHALTPLVQRATVRR